MKYTQNERINQITESTLVIGIDIASETHYAIAFDNRGIEYGKVISFNNDQEGFCVFSAWIDDLMENHHKNRAVIAMKLTGHYWFNITHYLKDSRAAGRKRATHLYDMTKSSVGVRTGLRAAENELNCLLEQYMTYMRQYKTTMALLEELVMQIQGVTEMLEIKGIGLITAAGFLAEVGDINRFDHPKQIQKLAGLNLKENSSGKHKGKTTISKRGRKRLRSILFQCMIPLLATNQEFREIHKYYTTRENNPLKKRQSMVLISCKLIRAFFTLLEKKVAYNPQKMLNDITREVTLIAA